MVGGFRSLLARFRPALVVLFSLDLSTLPFRFAVRFTELGWESSGIVLLFVAQTVRSSAIGWAFGWTLYGVAFFVALPRVYPGQVGERLKDAYSLRAGIATVAVLLGMEFERRLVLLEAQLTSLTGSPLPSGGSVSMYVILLLAALYVQLLFVVLYQADYRLETGFFQSFAFESKSWRRDSSIGDFPRLVQIGIRRVDLFLFNVVILVLLALAAIAANLLFPVFELLSLVLIAVVWFAPDRSLERVRHLDVEERFFRSIRAVRFGPKGVLVLTGLVFGLLPALVTCLFTVVATPAFLNAIAAGGGIGMSELLVLIPGFAVLVAYGWYSLWYWLRILQRMPFFLSEWTETPPGSSLTTVSGVIHGTLERNHQTNATPQLLRVIAGWVKSLAGIRGTGAEYSSGNHEGATKTSEPLTRPPGLLIQPALMYLFFNNVLHLKTEGVGLRYYVLFYACTLFFVWWLWRSVRWTLQSPPQPPLQDNFALPGAICIQFGGYLLSSELNSGTTLAESLIMPVYLSVLVVFLFYLSDLLQMVFSKDEDVIRRGAVVSGGFVFLIALLNIIRGSGLILTLLLIGFSAIIALYYYYNTRVLSG